MIDPRAVVDPAAQLAADVHVGPYSIIGPEARIGPGTWIGPHVVINGPTTLGAGNRIFPFACLGEIPQDKKYTGERSELIIGNHNTIREYCTINRGTQLDQGRTVIGNDNWIMAYVHIAHDCHIGDHTVFANGATLAGHVTVEDFASLGGFTLVHQFCRIGRYAFSGMGSALNRDLPPFVLATGNLAKPHGINKEGLRRHGFAPQTLHALHQAYLLLFKGHSKRQDARERLNQLAECFPDVAYLLDFIHDSPRGVIR